MTIMQFLKQLKQMSLAAVARGLFALRKIIFFKIVKVIILSQEL